MNITPLRGAPQPGLLAWAARSSRPHAQGAAARATLLLAACVFGLFVAQSAQAGPGHDHAEPAPVAAGPALPRFAVASDQFELVGVLEGRLLTLYLDQHADNAPVAGARIELDMAGVAHQAQALGPDRYRIELPAAPAAGLLPITATVTVGSAVDLLAAELSVPGAEHGDHGEHGAAGFGAWAAARWPALGAGLVLTAVLLGLGVALVRRRRAAGGAA